MPFGLGFPAEGENVVKPLMVKVLGVVSLVMRLVGRADVRAEIRRMARARRWFVESMMSVVFGGMGDSVSRAESCCKNNCRVTVLKGFPKAEKCL